MKYLDVRLRQPDWMLHPMQTFIREEDVVTYEELLTWNLQPEAGVEYELFYVEADLERYRPVIDAVDSIREYTIAPIDDESFHVYACQETRPEDTTWRSAFADLELLVVPPVRYDQEAAMTFTLVGDGESLQTMLDGLPEEIQVTVNEIGTYDRRGGTMAGVLTDRQLDAVAAALDVGYYDVPRRAGIEVVADRLDVAASTASELVRRAEQAVMSKLLDRYGGRIQTSEPSGPRP